MQTKVDTEADERRQRVEEGGHGMIARLTVDRAAELNMDGTVSTHTALRDPLVLSPVDFKVSAAPAESLTVARYAGCGLRSAD